MLKGANRPREGILATVIGVGTLVFAAVGVVVQLKDALNTVWEVETPPGSGICASCVANPPESPRSNARILVAVRSGISAKPTRLSRLAPLIAFCVDARGPRATSGQDRAYSAARDDIPDRTALSANNWRARCTISKPRRRSLTLHSKTVGPSKCSYRLMAPIARGFIPA